MANQKVTFLPTADSSMRAMLRELVQATTLMKQHVDHLSAMLEQANPTSKAA
jgi:uncharacterized protein Yka (UPF0111/DUF47 family)